MTRVLHLTPHMGGGVGKAISGLVAEAGAYDHRIVCLEQPEKSQFVEKAREGGCAPIFCPDPAALDDEIAAADIVQLEFWNHPATVAMLCSRPLPAMRLLVWCHISGLHQPAIPAGLLRAAAKFLFTSDCSLEAESVRAFRESGAASGLGVVSSGGGLDELPPPRPRLTAGPLTAGYLGSLNYAKLHPDFVSFAAAVAQPGFSVRMIGDETNRADLERQCREIGRADLLEFRGYRADVAAELADLDVLVYLLNPTHYGTAENALIEAMAMGIVPVVLANSAERHIVEDGRTGMLVADPASFAAAMAWLADHPEERAAMGSRAAAFVREQFSYHRMAGLFSTHYDVLLRRPKEEISFRPIFGDTPAQWFRAFQPDGTAFRDDGTVSPPDGMALFGVMEQSKGSVFHFGRSFPEDSLLRQWGADLVRLQS